MSKKLREHELEDDYPIYPSYYYVCDGEVYCSEVQCTAERLKSLMGFKSVKNCDLRNRGFLNIGEIS